MKIALSVFLGVWTEGSRLGRQVGQVRFVGLDRLWVRYASRQVARQASR